MTQGLAMPMQELERELAAGPDGRAANVPEKFFCLLGLGMLRELEALLKTAPIQMDGAIVRLPLRYRGSESAKMPLLAASMSKWTALLSRWLMGK
jgi:hypothetical protein